MNLNAAQAQTAVRDTVHNKSTTLGGRLQTFFLQKVASPFNFVNEAARNTATFLVGDVAHCRSAVRQCLEGLAGQYSAHGGSSVI